MLDSGLIDVYSVENESASGMMPKYRKTKIATCFYEERTIGVTRYYNAIGANRKIDMVVRIWRNNAIAPEMVVEFENGERFRISFISHSYDNDGIAVSDLTLEKVANFYEY